MVTRPEPTPERCQHIQGFPCDFCGQVMSDYERAKLDRRCDYCFGKGYVPGDPEGAPIEDCQKCKGTGVKP